MSPGFFSGLTFEWIHFLVICCVVSRREETLGTNIWRINTLRMSCAEIEPLIHVRF